MRYTKLGRTGLDVGILGLGMEHLTPENIGPVVARAVEAGMNYIDIMIWVPERKDAFGAALHGRRDKVILAGHLSVAESNGQYRKTRDLKECDFLFHDQLRRLGTDYVDILHVSYVDGADEYAQVTGPGGVLEMALHLQRQGKARFLAMSGHVPEIAAKFVESGVVDVVMQPINLKCAGWEPLASLCRLCAGQGVGMVVMKAFKGGEFFKPETRISPIPALSYALAQPGVATVAMGVKTVAELEANLAYLDASAEERDFTAAVAAAAQVAKGTCVYCNHCLPCPPVIDIPQVLRLLDSAGRGVTPQLRAAYAALPAKASDCIECGACLERCPFGVAIIDKMHEAVEVFGA